MNIPETLTRRMGPPGKDVYWQLIWKPGTRVGVALMRTRPGGDAPAMAASAVEDTTSLDVNDIIDIAGRLQHQVSNLVEIDTLKLVAALDMEIQLDTIERKNGK